MHKQVLGANLPSVQALAFLGDAEYSVFVRRLLVRRGIGKSGELNRLSLSYVTAERQAALMRRIEPLLYDDERDVFRRAANSTHLNRPKHASIADYRYATGFEALLGMLSWLGDTERLSEILHFAEEEPVFETETICLNGDKEHDSQN